MASFLELVTSEIGQPYRYGGDTPQAGFDCSGLVYWAAGAAGIGGVPRVSSAQFVALPATTTPGPGDLVFFRTPSGPQPGHVGVCSDAGCSNMIDALHSGALVQQRPVSYVASADPVAGYRRLPGSPAQIGGGTAGPLSAGAANATLTSFNPLDPFGVLGGLGDLSNPLDVIGKLLAQIPAAFLKVLFGDHSIAELGVRTLEILGGALVGAAGVVLLVSVVVRGSPVEPAARRVRRSGRQIGVRARTVGRSLDTGARTGLDTRRGGAGGRTAHSGSRAPSREPRREPRREPEPARRREPPRRPRRAPEYHEGRF